MDPLDNIFAKWSVCYHHWLCDQLAHHFIIIMNSQRILLQRYRNLQLQLCHKNEKVNKEFPHSDQIGQETIDDRLDLSQLLRLIECPVCRTVPTPPIHNCVNGHFICGSCRPHLSREQCAYCLQNFTGMRNYPLESLVSTPLVRCDFAKFGCTVGRLTLAEYEDHVQQCWAQVWRPGQVKRHQAHQSREDEEIDSFMPEGDLESSRTCRKCQQENSTRRVKCRKCDGKLRPPTPLNALSDFNFTF